VNRIYFNDIYGNRNGQAFEEYTCTDNQWDNGTTGNYWGIDYINKYPNAANDGKYWNAPYMIGKDGSGLDHFPLVNSVTTDDTAINTTIDTTDDTPGFSLMVVIFTGIFLLIKRKNEN
jgi:hypothetical protein